MYFISEEKYILIIIFLQLSWLAVITFNVVKDDWNYKWLWFLLLAPIVFMRYLELLINGIRMMGL